MRVWHWKAAVRVAPALPDKRKPPRWGLQAEGAHFLVIAVASRLPTHPRCRNRMWLA